MQLDGRTRRKRGRSGDAVERHSGLSRFGSKTGSLLQRSLPYGLPAVEGRWRCCTVAGLQHLFQTSSASEGTKSPSFAAHACIPNGLQTTAGADADADANAHVGSK